MSTEPAQAARRLVRAARSGTLATLDAEGAPVASLVTLATDHRGQPILLLSQLAEHTRNLARDARASILVERASGRRNPQTGPRVTLKGSLAPDPDAGLRSRFLARHEQAARYADFGDFAFYRMTVTGAQFVGGFARAHRLTAEALLTDAAAAEPLAQAEVEAVRHMNDDHADALDLYARRLLGRRGRGWRCVGLDADGVELVLDGRLARVDFDRPVDGPAALRAGLKTLADRARAEG